MKMNRDGSHLLDVVKRRGKIEPVLSVAQEAAIRKEFGRLKDQHYLDHAGSTLYSETQISQVTQDLVSNVYGNPHALNTSSKLSESTVDQIRFRILRHFRADPGEYDVVFTSGATGALKILAETFRYQGTKDATTGKLVYLEDNHTSVLGMREYAASSICLSCEKACDVFSSMESSNVVDFSSENNFSNSLFVYPAQSNFSGTKYPLEWIEKVKTGGILNNLTGGSLQNWYVALDAASFASTSFLDLSKYKPDFVCLSFYKIFGYPTGLGALLVRSSSTEVLHKQYFGGGTVLLACTSERVHFSRPILHEAFEDGTIPFLSIASLKHGFDTFERLGLSMMNISKHTFSLAQYVYDSLSEMRHENENPVAILYHDTNFERAEIQGPIVNFNLLRSCGKYVGYAEVMHVANLFQIFLRTGCFCNPGACKRHLKQTTEDVLRHFKAGHVCGDQNDLIDGAPTGSVRISFGYMSTKKDCDAFLNMLKECFVTKSTSKRQANNNNNTMLINGNSKVNFLKLKENGTICDHDGSCVVNGHDESSHQLSGVLKEILIYPVKSCGAFEVNKDVSWEITKTGLKYDRNWMIVDSRGIGLTQKYESRLCLIKPIVDLSSKSLHLFYQDEFGISLNLNEDIFRKKNGRALDLKCQNTKVCSDTIQGYDCGDAVAAWLDYVLDMSGLRMLKLIEQKGRSTTKNSTQNLSLSNEAQYLLVNASSVRWLLDQVLLECAEFDDDLQAMTKRFRPNLVVDFGEAFIENQLAEIRVGNSLLFKCERMCIRCQMICINQASGEKSIEPLKTLSKEFNGTIKFGMYLSCSCLKDSYLKLDESVTGIVKETKNY